MRNHADSREVLASKGRVRHRGLYAPDPIRDDERLGVEIDERLADWAMEVGIYAEHPSYFRACQFGRLIMLACPDTDDVDRLMLGAKWMAALFATDDYFADDERFGAVNELVAARLTFAMSAMDPPHPIGEYAAQITDQLRGHPVLVALSSSLDHIRRYATPAQVARVRHETLALFFTWTAEAGWRSTGQNPPVWEFLAERQHNSFLPAMSLIDVVNGYELPADVYFEPAVRQAVRLAADAVTLVNDIYSMGKEAETEMGDFNLPTLIATERKCTLHEALEICVAHHNSIAGAYETACSKIGPAASPELRRFLNGLWAWMAGSLEWHTSSGRYTADAQQPQSCQGG